MSATDTTDGSPDVTYLLYRTERMGAGPAGSPLGTFTNFDAALTARDDDLLTQLHRQPAPAGKSPI